MEILGIDITDLLNPQFYIEHGGLWMILFIVFAETGLFAGFFYLVMRCFLLPVFLAQLLKLGLVLLHQHYLKPTINGLIWPYYGY